MPLGEVSREIVLIDILISFTYLTKSSETGLGYTTGSTALLSDICQVSFCVYYDDLASHTAVEATQRYVDESKEQLVKLCELYCPGWLGH